MGLLWLPTTTASEGGGGVVMGNVYEIERYNREDKEGDKMKKEDG